MNRKIVNDPILMQTKLKKIFSNYLKNFRFISLNRSFILNNIKIYHPRSLFFHVDSQSPVLVRFRVRYNRTQAQ